MNNNLRFFTRKVIFFIFPLIILFVVLDSISVYVGELRSVRDVVRVQNNNPKDVILYGRKVVDQELRKYKYEMYNIRQSDIYAIGSSRILSIREEFFLPYYSFTNLGSIVHNIGDLEDLSYRIASSSSSKYIFICLDYYWFGNKRTDKSDLTKDLNLINASIDWRAHMFASRYVANSLIENPAVIRDYFDTNNEFNKSFGFQGISGNGYRRDGSYLYSNFLAELRKQNVYRDREQPSIIERIKSGSGSYVFNSRFDEGRLLKLDGVLKRLKQKNYYVIGLDLPYSSEVYLELLNNPNHKELFAKYREKIPPVFLLNGFPYFDFADLKNLNLSDLYMFDGVHPSETASANMMVDVLRKLSSADFKNKDFIISHLRAVINSSKTTTYELDKEILVP